MAHVSCSVCGALCQDWRATPIVPDDDGHARQLCPTCVSSLRRDLPPASWARLTAVGPEHRRRRRAAPPEPVQLPLC